MTDGLTRRGFLKTGAALPALGATLAAGSTFAVPAAAQTTGRLKLGLVTYNLAKAWDIETIIKNCTEAKFEGVELRSTHAHGVEPDISKARRKEVRARFADSSVASPDT